MNAAVAQERWQGQVVDGKFSLLEWLGGSANTAVFRTELPRPTSQPAAIKLIRADGLNAAQQIARWKESAALSHSNLLRIFDSGHCQITGAHWLYVLTDFAEENLDQVLPVRPLSAEEVAEFLPPVLDALGFLHAKGLVHGRIKPSNICAVNNQLKLSIDSVQPAGQKGRDRTLSAYDAPEAEPGVLSDASDIWSLGMLLVAAFNQRPLTWSRSSGQDLAVPKSVPVPYSQIAAGCLRINSEARCSLERIKELTARGVPPAKTPVVRKPAPKARSNRKIVVPVVIVLAAVAITFSLFFRHPKTSEPQQPATVEQANENAAPASENPAINRGSTQAFSDKIITRVVPQVPLSARATIHGKIKVKVRVSVGPDGRVSSATLATSGPSRYFARLALEASQKWKFAPVEQAERRWLLEYKFARTSTEVTPVESH
jgi:TonB family protein